MKNALINVGLLFGTVIFFFGGIEIALRVTGLQTTKSHPPLIYRTSDIRDISYELKPDIREKAYKATVTTNSLGFRSPELDPGKPTIAVLGDSIAFGYGLEDEQMITAKLAALLPAYNVLNTAAPGYNIAQETATYREKVRPLDPEILILIFHFNDLENMDIGKLDDEGILRSSDWTPEAETCDPITVGILGWIPARCWLDTHSAFYRAVKKMVQRRAGTEELKKQETAEQEAPSPEQIPEENLERYSDELDELLLLQPPEKRLFVIWPERKMHEEYRQRLKTIVEERGFAFLDLYETFGNQAPTLGWDTVHPNAETVERAAGIVEKTVRELLE